MISEKIKNILKHNWGERADAMDCYAEVKFTDNLSGWSCYIYAINPRDEDQIECILRGHSVEIGYWSLTEIYSTYNAWGDPPKIDNEYRRTKVDQLYKRLGGK